MLKISWRNVLRNKRRSLLSLLIITIGVAVLYLVNGYIKGAFDGLKTMSVSQYGNLQIAKKGYWANDNQRHLLTPMEIGKIKEILASHPEIVSYTSSLAINGIIGTENVSTIVQGNGIELEDSQTQNIMVTSGVNLFEGDYERALLGKGVMQRLGVKENEWITFMATTLDGAYNAGNIQVSGSYTVGNSDADNAYIILPISYAQNIMNTEGVDKLIVNLSNINSTDTVVEWLNKQFVEDKLDLGVKSWLDLALYYRQVRSLYEIIFYFMSTVVFFLVLVSILEIMSMAFFERMNEIGTIRAIGTKCNQVFSMLIEEGLILGLFGGIIGLMVGCGVGNFINQLNITYTAPSMSQPVPLILDLSLFNGILPFMVVILATLFSAFYPAFRASKLNIVEILRHH